MVSKDKAYIVANEQQEREVLKKLEKDGFMWTDHANKPTELVPSIEVSKQFPYAIVIDRNISLKLSNYFEHYEIVYDGRKEKQMSDKYVVSQEFMNTLNLWREKLPSFSISNNFVGPNEISTLPDVVKHWWCKGNNKENNNCLIAIIRWVNGEDVFEIEKPKKWVVRSKETDIDGDYRYVQRDNSFKIEFMDITHLLTLATRFDTKEEAQSWANSHQEVVEVEE